jgi:hypothetical protein
MCVELTGPIVHEWKPLEVDNMVQLGRKAAFPLLETLRASESEVIAFPAHRTASQNTPPVLHPLK